MKIAYFGSDWYLDCLKVFQRHGHVVSHIFTSGEQPYNQKLRNYAAQHNIPVYTDKPSKQSLLQLKADAVDCIYSTEYSWLIPIANSGLKSINMHPTLLPEGRGPTPLIWLLQKYQEHAGITFHKLSDEFDQGEVIYQRPLVLNSDETWETLVAKLHINVPIMLDKLLSNFSQYYDNAKIQTNGSYWPKVVLKDRTINWNDKVSNIQQLARSCGRFGIVAHIEEQTILVNHLQTSQCQHHNPPGTLLNEDEVTYVMAASDGIVVVMKSSITERSVTK